MKCGKADVQMEFILCCFVCKTNIFNMIVDSGESVKCLMMYRLLYIQSHLEWHISLKVANQRIFEQREGPQSQTNFLSAIYGYELSHMYLIIIKLLMELNTTGCSMFPPRNYCPKCYLATWMSKRGDENEKWNKEGKFDSHTLYTRNTLMDFTSPYTSYGMVPPRTKKRSSITFLWSGTSLFKKRCYIIACRTR